MPSYEIKSRVKHAPAVQTVDALHREDAIAQVVYGTDPGDEVEVFSAVEIPGTGDAGGATGASGGMFAASPPAGHPAGPTGS